MKTKEYYMEIIENLRNGVSDKYLTPELYNEMLECPFFEEKMLIHNLWYVNKSKNDTRTWLEKKISNKKSDILKRLNSTQIMNDSNNETIHYIESIKVVKIFFCVSGRNAWYSTWVRKYSENSMHLTLSSAKKYCELKRVQGSVFYIEEVPALYITGGALPIYVLQINERVPFSNYYLKTEYKEKYPQNKSYYGIGSSLEDFIYTFDWQSSFWKKRISSFSEQNIQTYIFYTDAENEALEFDDFLQAWKSNSCGSDSALAWTQKNLEKYECTSMQLLADQL